MGETDNPVLNIILREVRELRADIGAIKEQLAEQRGAQKSRAAIYGVVGGGALSIVGAVVKHFLG